VPLASWMDHPRDLLHMINHFRSEMPMPIVGIGHSLGGNMLVNLSLMHPRLLSTLVLLDPVIQHHPSAPEGPSPTQQSTFRRDHWPSRAEAEAAFRKQKFYQSWDPRVFDRWCKFGIRETPTALYPGEHGSVTLTTTKHQEVFTFSRPSWPAMSEDGSKIVHREMVPDLHPNSLVIFPFYRPEPPNTLARLGELRPSVLYIFGETSPMSSPDARKIKMSTTGTGLGGSGGTKEGRVKEAVLKGIGHLVAMEASDQCADAAAPWFGQEIQRFHAEMRSYLEWTKKSLIEKSTVSQEWQERVGGPPRRPKGKL
jgi:pimeloyl-ACP methyl ester carboxylesterase